MGEFYDQLSTEEATNLINERVAENDKKLSAEIDRLTS
jgi:hypothetical protein